MFKRFSNSKRFVAAGCLVALPILLASKALVAQQAQTEPTIRPTDKVRSNASTNSDYRASETETEEDAEAPLIEGFTEPYADINLAASEMGTLSEVSVKDGDQVKAGQLVAKLDDAVLQASLAVAKAGMSAEGELKSAETQLELKKVELKKLTELFDRNHASQKELDRIIGEVRIAESRILSVKEDLEVRKLEYARIEAQLKQRQVLATIDGVVVDVRKDRGEFVSPSDPVVARIVQLNPLLVVFSVPSEKRGQVTNGQNVAMQIGPTAAVANGHVEHVSPTADASSGTFKVKVRLANPDFKWHGGEKSVLLLDSGIPTFNPGPIAKNVK